MPQERPIEPPLSYPVTELRWPSAKDAFFTILVDRTSDMYQQNVPIYRGQPYASLLGADQRTIDQYTSNPYYFLKEIRPGNSSSSDFGTTHDYVIWVFANQRLAQDPTNSEITYEENGVSFPAYVREYDVKRQVYEANPTITPGTALTGLLSVAITAGGTGYTAATGTIATGATVTFVCYNGAIIDGIVTNEGSSVTSGAAITITGDGAGATATARIQPASAVLIQQKKEELPPDNPRSHDYVRLVRVYQTIPGPPSTDYKYDATTDKFLTVTKTKRLTSAISPGTAIVSVAMVDQVQITELENIDQLISWEIVTVYPRGPYYDRDHYIETEAWLPFQFPATMDTALFLETSGLLGFTQAYVRRRKHITRKWWVIDDVKPFINAGDAPLDGLLDLGYIFAIGGNGTYNEVLYDAITLFYPDVTLDFPGSSPDLTTYLSTYVGNSFQFDGSVQQRGTFFQWEVSVTYIIYEIQPAPTPS